MIVPFVHCTEKLLHRYYTRNENENEVSYIKILGVTLYFLSGGPFLTGAASGSCNETKGENCEEDCLIIIKLMAICLS